MDLKLYEIPQAFRKVFDSITIDEETGEIVGFDKVDEITESAKTKLANTGRFIRELENHIAAMKEVKKTLEKRIKAAEKLDAYLSVWVVNGLLALPDGKRKLEEPDIRLSTRKTESVEIINEKKIDEKYIRTKIVTTKEPDKVGIKAAINAGETVDGARLNVNYTLQIK